MTPIASAAHQPPARPFSSLEIYTMLLHIQVKSQTNGQWVASSDLDISVAYPLIAFFEIRGMVSTYSEGFEVKYKIEPLGSLFLKNLVRGSKPEIPQIDPVLFEQTIGQAFELHKEYKYRTFTLYT